MKVRRNRKVLERNLEEEEGVKKDGMKYKSSSFQAETDSKITERRTAFELKMDKVTEIQTDRWIQR